MNLFSATIMAPALPFAGIHFAAGDWFWPALILTGIALIAVWVLHLRQRPSPGMLPLLLKTIGFSLLGLCLLEPEWIREVTEDKIEAGIHVVAVVADNSPSLQLRDAKNAASDTRAELLRQTLKDGRDESKHWLNELGEVFKVRSYLLDQGLERSEDFSELDFQGESTALYHGLASLQRRYAGQPLAATILLTDGIATDEFPRDLSGHSPIYPILLGSDRRFTDASLGEVNVTQTAFEEAPVTIQVEVRSQEMKGKKLTLQLKSGDEVIESRELIPGSDEHEEVIRFTHRPDASGVQFYQLTLDAGETEEATLENNQRYLTVNRGQGPYRILYLSGRPNWEYKFLNRSVKEDKEIDLVGLIRLAKREPKFTYRGKSGESSNPLFRGFGSEEDTEYDQPVMIRQNTRDEKELAGGFPKEADDLFGYHAIILDDVEAAFFTIDQMELIQTYVSQRGGGLLMLGGQESFYHGGYRGTPLDDALPVYTHKPEPPVNKGSLKLALTREGWLQPWVRLRDDEASEKRRLLRMPNFHNLNTIRAIKPGASVIAEVLNQQEKLPALVAHRFGDGRVAALLIADFWRWGFNDPKHHPDMQKAWRQMLRWLIADVPSSVQIELIDAVAASDAKRIIVQARDASFEAVSEADIQLILTDQAGNQQELDVLPSLEQAGHFEAVYRPKSNGAYKVHAIVNSIAKAGQEATVLGEAEAGWALNRSVKEFASLQANRDAMERLAKETGGEVLELSDLSKLKDRIPHPTVSITKTEITPLWHVPWVFLLAIGCFIFEWALRRKKGFA